MKRKLVTMRRLKRPWGACKIHPDSSCKGDIEFTISGYSYQHYIWFCDAGLAELIAALNEAAEKVKQ